MKLEDQENDGKVGDVKVGNHDEHEGNSNGATIERFIQSIEGTKEKPSILLTVFGM